MGTYLFLVVIQWIACRNTSSLLAIPKFTQRWPEICVCRKEAKVTPVFCQLYPIVYTPVDIYDIAEVEKEAGY